MLTHSPSDGTEDRKLQAITSRHRLLPPFLSRASLSINNHTLPIMSMMVTLDTAIIARERLSLIESRVADAECEDQERDAEAEACDAEESLDL